MNTIDYKLIKWYPGLWDSLKECKSLIVSLNTDTNKISNTGYQDGCLIIIQNSPHGFDLDITPEHLKESEFWQPLNN